MQTAFHCVAIAIAVGGSSDDGSFGDGSTCYASMVMACAAGPSYALALTVSNETGGITTASLTVVANQRLQFTANGGLPSVRVAQVNATSGAAMAASGNAVVLCRNDVGQLGLGDTATRTTLTRVCTP